MANDLPTAEEYYAQEERYRRAPRRAYQDIPTLPNIGDWDQVGRIKGALLEHEQGVFHATSMLCESVWTDDRIRGVWSSRVSVLGLPVEFRGVEDDKVREAAEEDFPKMASQAALRQLKRWGDWLGVGYAEKLWVRDERTGRWLPKLKVWHPRYLRWRFDLRCFEVTTMDGTIPLDFENDAQVRAKWIRYAPYGDHRGWMEGMIRTLAIPWLVRSWALRDWARHSEVYGMGIRKATVPQGADDRDKKRFLSDLAKLASEGVVMLPKRPDGTGFDLELLQAEGGSQGVFRELREACDTSVAVTIVGQNLTTEVKGGSFAAASIHQSVKAEIIRADGVALRECLGPGLFAEWAQVNFGDAAMAPAPWYQTDPPEDRAQMADTMKKAGDAAQALRSGGINVDLEELAERSGVPVVEGEPEYTPPPAPEKPPAGPGGKRQLSQAAVKGQTRVDDLHDEALAQGKEAFRASLDKVLSLVAEAADYEQLRRRVLAEYKHLDSHALAKVLEKAILLAELSGRWSVQEEA